MALERQSIEKKDFPIGARGYDPDAVDAHLSSLADQIEELKRAARRRSGNVALAAGDQVRAIVEAAEKTAAEIQRQAERDAQETRAEAVADAQSARARASAQAREYAGKFSESTDVMLQRLDGMESELSALIESLRMGVKRLTADLQLLQAHISEVDEAAAPRPRFEPEAGHERAAAEREGAAAAGHAGAAAGREGGQLAAGSNDIEGARLVALNMALNGTPREETDRYLAANFELGDRGRLLDEVYATVER